MRIGKNIILGDLPPLKGEEEVLVDCQDVNDIISAVVQSHKIFAADYDQIWPKFYNADIKKICSSLFDFCKNNIPYVEESDNLQTVKSPAAILALSDLSGGDCKHYASFIGGVLDAINRNTDKSIKWTYRFASYKLLDNSPGHVFVVVSAGNKNEIWVDPVLSVFDSREEIPYFHIDKKPKISGIGRINRSIGVIPLIAIEAVTSLIPAIVKLIGSNLQGTLQTRQLWADFMINVQGQGGLYENYFNSNLDTPAQTQLAQAWFSAVLGVPILDYDRYSALAGLSTALVPIQLNANTHEPISGLEGLTTPTIWVNPGDPNGRNVQQRLADYKTIANLSAELSGVTDDDIIQAINIASNMEATRFNDQLAVTPDNKPGQWASLPVADSNSNANYFTANASNLMSGADPVTSTTSSSTSSLLSSSYLPWILAGGGALLLLSNKKKVSGMNKNTEMILLVGVGAVAIYFLTRPKTTTAAVTTTTTPVTTPTSLLSSLTTSLSNLFSSGPNVPSSGNQGQPVATTIANPTPITTPDPGSIYTGPISTTPNINIFQPPYLDTDTDTDDNDIA